MISMLAIGISSLTASVTLKEGSNVRMSSLSENSSTFTKMTRAAAGNESASTPVKAPVAAADAEETWTDLGVAKFGDGWWMPRHGLTPDDFKWDVPVQKSSRGDIYKLKSPYKSDALKAIFTSNGVDYPFTDDDFDIIIDCTDPNYVKMSYQQAATIKRGVLQGYLLPTALKIHGAANFYEKRGKTPQQITAAGYASTYKDGVITIKAAVFGLGDAAENAAGNSFAQSGDPYDSVIMLPGAKDYSVKATMSECCTRGGSLRVMIHAGADVAKVKMSVQAGIFPFSAEIFTTLENNNLLYDVTPSAQGEKIDAQLNEDTHVTVFVAGYNEAGERVAMGGTGYCYEVDDDANWTSMGKGTFTDALGELYGATSETYQVDVERHKTTEGLYRIVNPYTTPAWKYAENNVHSTEHNHYLKIDATNPERVIVPFSVVGFNAAGCDYLQSYNLMVSTPDTKRYGTLRSGVVTLPANSVVDMTAGSIDPYIIEGVFKLVLPTGSGIEGVMGDGDADAPVEYFNLQGQRILNPAAGQLVIRRQGGDVTKMIVR